MSMDPDEPDRPYSTARRALVDWTRVGMAALTGPDVDPVEWLDSYAAEVWDQGAREHGAGIMNPYYEGRPVVTVPDEWPTVDLPDLGELTLDAAAAVLRRRPMHGDDWTRTLDPTSHADACMCSKRHAPPFLEINGHHLWPVFLGGPVHPDTLLQLCPNTHTSAHKILRAMLKAGTVLPRALGQPKYAHMVASAGFQAWDAAGRPKELPR